MSRRLLDSPWPYFSAAGILLLGDNLGLLQARLEGTPDRQPRVTAKSRTHHTIRHQRIEQV